MSTDPNPVSPSTFFGGKEVTVTFRDPKRDPEKVFVRELKPSEFSLFLSARYSMTQSVEFATDQPAGFGDSVAPDSLLELDEEVEKQNPFFGRWLIRQGPRLVKLNALERSASGGN